MRVNPFSALLALGTLVTLAACTGGPGASAADVQAKPAAATRATTGQPPRNQCNAQAVQSLVASPSPTLRWPRPWSPPVPTRPACCAPTA